MPSISPLDFIKSLTFGGLVGGAIGAILYLVFQKYFLGIVGIKTFCGFTALLGAAFQRGVTMVFKAIFPSIGRFASYYERLIEATVLYKAGVITAHKHQEIISSLTDERFQIEHSQKQLSSPETDEKNIVSLK